MSLERWPSAPPWTLAEAVSYGWQEAGRWVSQSTWHLGELRVVSSVLLGCETVLQWRLSVAVVSSARRPSAVEMLHVRRAFGMLEASEESNSHGMDRILYLAPVRVVVAKTEPA